MRNLWIQVKSLSVKALVIGSCLTMITSYTAFAAEQSDSNQAVLMDYGSSPAMPPDQSYDGYDNEALRVKHQEIDDFIFGQKGDFSDQGFNVTHTGPMEGKIEIGITPYDEAKAQYLYDVFGEEWVNVVEGIQAVTLDIPASQEDTIVSSSDESISEDSSQQQISSEQTAPGSEAATVAASTEALEASNPSNPSNPLYMTVILVIALVGGVALLLHKRQATKR